MKIAELQELLSLMEMGKTKDVAFYVQGRRQLNELQERVRALNDIQHENGPSNEGDIRVMAKWHRWAEQEASKLTARADEVACEIKKLEMNAKKSLAKVQAVKMLLKQAHKEELIQNRKRAEQNGFPPDA